MKIEDFGYKILTYEVARWEVIYTGIHSVAKSFSSFLNSVHSGLGYLWILFFYEKLSTSPFTEFKSSLSSDVVIVFLGVSILIK